MANVFNGNDFLKESEVELTFSNGLYIVINDIQDEGMAKLTGLEKIESPTLDDIRSALGGLTGKEAKDFAGVGIRELNKAIGFLSTHMFE